MKTSPFRQLIGPLVLLALCCVVASAQPNAIQKYLAKPDPVYGWNLVKTIPGEGYRAFVLESTSQTWRSEKDVDRPVWKHWLTVVKPDRVK